MKSDACSPLLVSITTVLNAAHTSPKNRRKLFRVDRRHVVNRLRVRQDVQPAGMARDRSLEEGQVESFEVLQYLR